MPEKKSVDEMVAIELPVEYWITILLALAALIESWVWWDEEGESGPDLDALTESLQRPELVTSITGPAEARRIILDALAERRYRTVWASERYDAKKALGGLVNLERYI